METQDFDRIADEMLAAVVASLKECPWAASVGGPERLKDSSGARAERMICADARRLDALGMSDEEQDRLIEVVRARLDERGSAD